MTFSTCPYHLIIELAINNGFADWFKPNEYLFPSIYCAIFIDFSFTIVGIVAVLILKNRCKCTVYAKIIQKTDILWEFLLVK